ncbi:MAG: hypothetical protein ACI8Q6_001856 [Granulosicoccus sp.]|jgi:hypothetical protein
MPANSRPKRDSMTANINSLVGNMMNYMETDIPYCRETILRFLSAVRSIEGVDVPKVNIENDAK